MTRPDEPQADRKKFTVRLAETEEEVLASQQLRYRVFVEEMGAQVDAKSTRDRVEQDAFDPYFDHLVLIDEHASGSDRIVGTYRLLKGDIARDGPGFYSSDEFDLTPIIESGRSVVELGRSCIDRRYRGKAAMLHMWNGVAEYVLSQDIEIMSAWHRFRAPIRPRLSRRCPTCIISISRRKTFASACVTSGQQRSSFWLSMPSILVPRSPVCRR